MNSASHPADGTARAGFVLYTAVLVLLLVGAAAGVFLQAAVQHGHAVRRWHASDQCLLDAQSALERVSYDLARHVETNRPLPASWFAVWSSNSLGSAPAFRIPALPPPAGGGAAEVVITNVNVASNGLRVDITLVARARRAAPPEVARCLRHVLRLAFGDPAAAPVPVFDYGYFVHQNGQVAGAATIVNGDVRVNENLRLSGGPIVNGNVYAAGVINGSRRTTALADYWAAAPSAARPSTPTGTNAIAWPMGYDPGVSRTVKAPLVAMPMIGAISGVAAAARGRLSQGTMAVEGIYDGPGPDGVPGTADDGCLILDGTAAPITIRGPVVVRGDVIIRGRVSGQGTLYAGRNIHIVGDLGYQDPPSWPKPDAAPETTAAANAARDLLVLAAKGNIVVGNYASTAWSNRVWGLLVDPNNVRAYDVDASDAALGYDSDANPTNGFRFDGRFFAPEAHGGRRLSGTGTNTVPRRYYESSLSDAALAAVSDPANVPRVEAALFSNHAILGNWGSSAPGGNSLLNGALAARVELGAYYGARTLNWDIRLGTAARDRVSAHLVATETSNAPPVIVGWRELHE